MNLIRRSPLLIAAALMAGSTAAPSIAQADRVAVEVGGSLHVGAGGHVHVKRTPRRARRRVHVSSGFHVGGHVRIGAGVRFSQPPPPPPECPPEPPVPAYYVAPPPPAPYVAQPAPVIVAPRPYRPRFGIGAFGGSTNIEGIASGDDLGLLGRFRLTRRIELEGEIAKSELADGARVDRRMGGALLFNFSPYGRLSPFILGGLGVSQSEIGGGTFTAEHGYGEIGAGLGLRLTRSLSLIADIRAGARELATQSDEVVPLTTAQMPMQEEENYTRARLGAILYF